MSSFLFGTSTVDEQEKLNPVQNVDENAEQTAEQSDEQNAEQSAEQNANDDTLSIHSGDDDDGHDDDDNHSDDFEDYGYDSENESSFCKCFNRGSSNDDEEEDEDEISEIDRKLNFLKLYAKKEEISEETVKYTLSVDEEVVMYDENEEKINNEMWKIARNVLASLQNKFVGVRTFYLHPVGSNKIQILSCNSFSLIKYDKLFCEFSINKVYKL